MLWVLLLSVWSSAILFLTRRRAREIAPYATAVLLGLAAFFCGLLIFLETPFARASPVPVEGLGLNPLLRHPAMMFHPPMLYSGYTLFTIPFAFAVGALITRRLDADWLRTTRPFALAAWLCLGVGIVLGARWSYSELGWGGYWGWDAVENASLMPWLIGTAFLHSAIVQEKRGMLRMWNVSLILGAGILAILGTFLVRSGILESIHAFGASTLGIPFLVLIAVLTLGSALLVISRAPTLRSERRLDSLLSREAIFLLNNLALVGLCFVILWGTFFPLISEAFTGTKSSVGPPWFSRYVTPLALVLVLLSGLGPALAWRRTTAANLRRTLLVPTAVGAIALVVLLAAGERRRPPRRARHVRVRRVRAGRRGAGVLARHPRPAGDVERLAAAGVRVAGAAQPAPLRRVHRARRRRGAARRRGRVLELPGRDRGAPRARRERARGRLRHHSMRAPPATST